MKNTIKTSIIVMIFIFGGCNPDCSDILPYLEIESMDLSINKITKSYDDGSFSSEVFDTSTSIDYDKLVIELIPSGNHYASNSSFNFRNLFVNTAYAGKCLPPGYKGTQEQIAEIIILSDSPLMTSSNVGDTLSPFFNISGYVGSEAINPTDLQTYISTTPPALTKLRLTLKDKPTGSDKHIFTIIYKQTNGKEFQLTTPEIRFN